MVTSLLSEHTELRFTQGLFSLGISTLVDVDTERR